MYGRNVGYLDVLLRRNSRDVRLFSTYGDKGNQWNAGSVSLPPCVNDFRVIMSFDDLFSVPTVSSGLR